MTTEQAHTIALQALAFLAQEEDLLTPYFWGWSIGGERMPALEAASLQVDGGPGQTEADLFLLGEKNLVLVEAKRLSGFGRCSRYLAERCPEIYTASPETSFAESIPLDADAATSHGECRYWVVEGARFEEGLDFGTRPDPGTTSPACSRHYQLGRLFLLGPNVPGDSGAALTSGPLFRGRSGVASSRTGMTSRPACAPRTPGAGCECWRGRIWPKRAEENHGAGLRPAPSRFTNCG